MSDSSLIYKLVFRRAFLFIKAASNRLFCGIDNYDQFRQLFAGKLE